MNKKNSVVIDDFRTTRKFIKDMLIELNYKCKDFENIDQSIQYFNDNKNNLIILDTFIKNIKFIENIDYYSKILNLKNNKIILTMMVKDELIIKKSETFGVKDFIIKPFDIFDLSKIIDSL